MAEASTQVPADDPEADLDVLIDQYLQGTLSSSSAERLLSHLQSRPADAGRLLDQLQLDAMLREVSGATMTHSAVAATNPLPRSSSSITEELPAKPIRRPWRITRWAAVAASLVVGAGLAWRLMRPPASLPAPKNVATLDPATAPAEAISASVAILTRSVDAQWRVELNQATASPGVGSVLEPGWLRLDAGLAQIEFFNGAQVVLEGPAELQLVSAGEAFIASGKIRADVPPQARGFRVNTPQVRVVDRGTSFGVDASALASRVHVFKGSVELLQPQTQPAVAADSRDLREGQAASVGSDGEIVALAADATAFATPEDMDRRLDESHRRWLTRWQSADLTLRADPTLLVRFDFENTGPSDRVLPNVATTAITDAAIVGCGWSEGRRPGKGALEFRGVADRVRVEVPGEWDSMTYLAWVRVHGTDRIYNSLFMSDSFAAGATHWQILRDGRVRLGVSGGRPQDVDSPVVFTPERLGQWIHLAVVYDGISQQVTHYVDGRRVSHASIQPRKLVVGRAELGNWNPHNRADGAPIRHFSGRIDEFSAFGRALSDEEIAAMYAVGAGLTETAAP